MTDREVEAISHFLRHFGSFGCRQISVRRTEAKPRTPEDVGRFVLEILAGWRAEGLDAERLYKVATRMPARAGPPADGRAAPTGAAPRGSDRVPAGARRPASRRP